MTDTKDDREMQPCIECGGKGYVDNPGTGMVTPCWGCQPFPNIQVKVVEKGFREDWPTKIHVGPIRD